MFARLADLSVHGANVQEGQIVLVQAEIGLEEQVDGVSRDGERIPVLRNLAWQLPAREAPVKVSSHGEGYQW
jgi:hypothetical protein